MANIENDLSVKLLAGQQKLEKNVNKLNADVSVLKTDVAELKEGQVRVEKFLINLENIIMPKINAIYENGLANRQQIDKLEANQINNTQKLENHEVRIIRLEQSRQ